MSKELFGHEVVGFDGAFDILAVDADSNAHQHVLRPLNHLLKDRLKVLLKHW